MSCPSTPLPWLLMQKLNTDLVLFSYLIILALWEKKGKGGKFKAVIILAEQRHLSKL